MGDQLVQRLTDANWEKRVGESDWIVEFYAPWCNDVDIIMPHRLPRCSPPAPAVAIAFGGTQRVIYIDMSC